MTLTNGKEDKEITCATAFLLCNSQAPLCGGVLASIIIIRYIIFSIKKKLDYFNN